MNGFFYEWHDAESAESMEVVNCTYFQYNKYGET